MREPKGRCCNDPCSASFSFLHPNIPGITDWLRRAQYVQPPYHLVIGGLGPVGNKYGETCSAGSISSHGFVKSYSIAARFWTTIHQPWRMLIPKAFPVCSHPHSFHMNHYFPCPNRLPTSHTDASVQSTGVDNVRLIIQKHTGVICQPINSSTSSRAIFLNSP